MAQPTANDLAARQAKLDAARAELARLEADQATSLHDQLAQFNSKREATFSELREKQNALNAEFQVEASRKQAEDTAKWEQYWARQEHELLALQEGVLEVVDRFEQATVALGQARQDLEKALAAYRTKHIAVAPDQRAPGLGWDTFFARLAGRVAALLTRLNNRNGYFGHIPLRGGTLFTDRETGWRASEEHSLSTLTWEAIQARRSVNERSRNAA